MNISQWPLSKIMQLPGWCFGRRWPVACELASVSDTPKFDISEAGLPEVCVIWSVSLDWSNSDETVHYCRLALGDVLPTAAAEVDVCEALLKGVGTQGGEPRRIQLEAGSFNVVWAMRMSVASAGRRLILELVAAELKPVEVRCVLEISSMPTEVPDWLVYH